jgi:hypothetical protein
MLYEVEETNKQLKDFEGRIQSDRESYSTYEVLCDSMNLMQYQTIEMRKDRKNFATSFSNLNMENAKTVAPPSNEQVQRLSKNISVYDANIGALARYNAETNLNEFASRRKEYTTEVGKYKK